MDSCYKELTYLLRDCLQKRHKTKSYLVKPGGERESSSFESFHWEKHQKMELFFLGCLTSILVLSVQNWAEAQAFTFPTLDLAYHIFPLLEEERKGGGSDFFLNARLLRSKAGELFATCLIVRLLVFLSPSDFLFVFVRSRQLLSCVYLHPRMITPTAAILLITNITLFLHLHQVSFKYC